MVVFTCGHCGESVNKPKVQKHYQTKCRNRNPSLSCMDCFKDFLGDDYESHTKCITEEERYSAKGFTAKKKKGEKKQNAWVEMLQSVLNEQKTAPKNVLRIIETISKHNNTPRKKPKFINFVKNVCGAKTSPKDIDQAWDLISVQLSALSNNNKVADNDKDTSGITNGGNKDINTSLNGDSPSDNGDDKENCEKPDEATKEKDKFEGNQKEENVVKLSKKQRKDEKKKKKYEAELQAASVETEEPEPKQQHATEEPNKNKKNKNKKLENGHNDAVTDGKGKNKKRKRLDTVPTPETNGKEVSVTENDINKIKATKKKSKTNGENEAEKSLCLHDQNVAQSEIAESDGKFNWHTAIVSVLQKKGNEVPFKRLQKKVLTEYVEHTGNEVDDRIADKFIKKLKSAPNVKVDKNRVLLIDE